MSGKDNGQVCCRTIYFCVLSHLYLYNSPNYTFINGWQLSSEGLESGSYEVKLGKIAHKPLREPRIDTELAYAYAKTDRLHDMEDFLSMTNVADILEVGEKCFEDELYQAAKLLFTSISNWARLATTLIYLGENQAAVESARKAGNTQ
jgi:hypothetical protein